MRAFDLSRAAFIPLTVVALAPRFFLLTPSFASLLAVSTCPSGTVASGSTCTAVVCSQGTYLSGSTCLACPTGCSACSSSTTCSACTSGYQLQGSSCAVVPPCSVVIRRPDTTSGAAILNLVGSTGGLRTLGKCGELIACWGRSPELDSLHAHPLPPPHPPHRPKCSCLRGRVVPPRSTAAS